MSNRVSVFELINRSVRNMGSGINPKVKDLAIELIKLSYMQGINVQITSGFRSYAEQNRLYAQGRTTPGNIVTNARAGQSIHNFGLAIDYVLVSHDGSKAIWTVNNDWRKVAAIGKSLGFQWGGDWRSFRDYPHLDMQRGMTLAQLRAGSRPYIPNVPNRNYSIQGDTGNQIKVYQGQLTKAGYPTVIDGAFGAGMEASVRKFQKAQGLEDDGIIGTGTARALANPSNNQVAQVTAPKPTAPSNQKNNTGVRYLNPSTVTFKNEVFYALQKARKKGIIEAEKWEKQFRAGEMTVDDSIALLYTIWNRTNNFDKVK